MTHKVIDKILSLWTKFVDKKLSGKEFEKSYSNLWRYIRDNDIRFTLKIHDILDEVWLDADVFVSDPKRLKYFRRKFSYLTEKEFSLRYIDETELRKRVQNALYNLKRIIENKRKRMK